MREHEATAGTAETVTWSMLPDAAPIIAYPRAPWRLADAKRLGSTVLWFSQIVIRHADARPEVSFSPAYWFSVIKPSRSRDDALALAERVASRAAEAPARFPELARKYSEDLSSRDEGGALGGIEADQIALWPQVLDALYAIEPGQTSKVVETAYGFHIFYRSLAPPEERVSGSHIVIGHDDATWLWLSARGDRPPRSREAALALANEVYRQATGAPERFAELVERYSEQRDAIAAGDLGSWSTREPSFFAPRMKRLRELAVGQVGAPIETHLGFEIIQRTPERPRSEYRAAVLEFHLDSYFEGAPRPPDAVARSVALEKAEATARQLRQDPSSFDALTAPMVQWSEGHDFSSLTPVLARLRFGEITREPVDSEYGFLLAQRLEPEPLPPATFQTELPEPEIGELAGLLAAQSAHDFDAFVQDVSLPSAEGRSISRAVASKLANGGPLAGVEERGSYGDRVALVTTWLEQLKQALGPSSYSRYHRALSRDVAARLLPVDESTPRLGL